MGRRTTLNSWLAVVMASCSLAQAQDSATQERVDELERRLRALEDKQADDTFRPEDWFRRFHLSGNADIAFLSGEKRSSEDEGRFVVDNARLFIDVDLASNGRVGDVYLFDSASFYFEWELYNFATFINDAASLNVRFDHLFGLEGINMRAGRMPIPYGEEYVRFSEQRPENPLIGFSAAAPYFWDEGIEFFGSNEEGSLRYILAVMDGDIATNQNSDRQPQLALKLSGRPTDWLELSASGLHTGKLGSNGNPGFSAIVFSFAPISPFGFQSNVTNFQDGAPIPDDPDLELETVNAAEVDAILSHPDVGHVWLGFGLVAIRTEGDSTYDRDLRYGVGEVVYELGHLDEALRKLYVAARYSAIGTFDSDEGYFLPTTNDGDDLGYNTESVSILSLGVGCRLSDNINLKTEYDWYEFDVVSGVPGSIRNQAGDRNFFGVALSVSF